MPTFVKDIRIHFHSYMNNENVKLEKICNCCQEVKYVESFKDLRVNNRYTSTCYECLRVLQNKLKV